MNERIKELIKQATSYAWNSCDVTEELDAEKFAQLIVQECIAICQDIDGEDNIDARSGRQDCAVEIKKHFGVEL